MNHILFEETTGNTVAIIAFHIKTAMCYALGQFPGD